VGKERRRSRVLWQDEDAFQRVQEWWNTGPNNFKAPSGHLFMKLGLKEPFHAGEYKIGDGKIWHYARRSERVCFEGKTTTANL